MTENQSMPDPEKVDKLRDIALRKMANGADPLLAEMAREVRSGRMTLREAAMSWAYRDAFSAAAEKTLARLRTMSPEEIAKGDTDEELDELIARHEHDDEPERPEQAEPDKPVVADRDEYDFNQPLARKPPESGPANQTPTRARWQRRW